MLAIKEKNITIKTNCVSLTLNGLLFDNNIQPTQNKTDGRKKIHIINRIEHNQI